MSESAGPIADMTDTLLGWASQCELELSQKLEKLGKQDSPAILADLSLASDRIERIERFFGLFLARQVAKGSTFEAIVGLCPAVTLTVMVARAQRLVAAETFGSEFLAGLGLSADAANVDALAETFVPQTLAQYTLSAPEGLSAVELLCLNAGLLDNEVAPLLELIDAQGTDNLRGSEELPPFFALSATHAPEVAERIAQGVVALREFSLQHPNSWFDRSWSGISPKLPTAILMAVAAELRERPAGTEHRDSAVGVANREMRPRILLDLTRKKLCLRLPEQRVPAAEPGMDPQVSWRVSVEGTTKVYRTGRAWGDVLGFSEPLDITLDHPVREVTVQDLTNGITWTVPVVNSEDAILLFTMRGNNVTEKASLHHQHLYALVPQDTALIDFVSRDPIEAADSFAVEGWAGWECRELDLHNFVSLAAGAQPAIEAVRSVDARHRVTFQAPGPHIDYLSSSTGLKVFSSSLLAEFPPTPSGQTETWYLSISSYAGVGTAGDEVSEPEPLEVPPTGGVFAVFDPELYDAPWVGEYLVRLKGPRNESFRHEYAIVEGAQATVEIAGASRSFRIPTGGGLSEATLTLKPSEKLFVCEPPSVVVGPEQAGADFIVHTEEGDQLPLRFSPPRLMFELPLLTEPAMWRASRLSLRPRVLDPEGSLRIRATGDLVDPKVTIRNNHGAPVNTTALHSEDEGLTYTCPMRTMAASAAVMPAGRIDLEWTDPRTDRRVSVALADLSSAEPETVELVKPEAADEAVAELPASTLAVNNAIGPVGAWVWPLTAPWAPARTLPVVDGTIELPVPLIEAGPLAVQLYSLDPFTVLRAPVAPGPGAHTIEQPGYFAGADEDLAKLSAFFAGASEDIPAATAVIPLLWDMLTTGQATATARGSINKLLATAPDAALKGLSESLVPSEKQPGRVVETALARCLFGRDVAEGEQPGERSDRYHRATWIGVLELLGRLDLLLEEPKHEEDTEAGFSAAAAFAAFKVDPKVSELVDELEALAGSNLIDTLKTGRDSTLENACIDQSTVAIAQMDEQQQKALLEMFFAGSNIVPGAIMDDGSRLLAVFETFTHREKIRELFASENLIQPAVTLLRTLRSSNRALYAMARVRFDKLESVDTDSKENGWSLAPVISLVLALASRMHAHGLITSGKTLDAVTPAWAKLADIVPDLVISDLVAAEAMVLAAKHQSVQL